MINIIEIKQKMTQGKTEPWLCLGDDDNQYVVKRLNATFKGCLYEWIAANLGERYGLAIPVCALVYVDKSLVEYDIDLLVGLGNGIGFGSTLKPCLIEVNVNLLRKANPQILKDLFMFDYWVNNGDRTLTESGGNPNLYFNLSTSSLVVFDHNLAFDQDFSVEDHKNLHVSSFLFRGQTDLFEPTIERPEYERKFTQALSGLDAIIATIPDEWLKEIPDALGEIERIRVVLGAFKHDDFWRALQ
ncbi:HipA family kinase [Paraglaciecola sp.]|uniref:HipA family kinase n=1 Tax=Paraglaciecola sp. TaxID=1920173 RepID=UPI0030F3CE9D